MKKILSFILSMTLVIGLCTNVYAEEKNYIVNGDFSQGTTGWQINKKATTDGTISVENNEMIVDLTTSNGNWWELGVLQGDINLTSNRKYRLSFEAKGSVEETIKVTVENPSDWSKYLGDTDVAIGQEYHQYQYEFETEPGGNAQLVFHMGQQTLEGQKVSIKNVSLIEIADITKEKIENWVLKEDNGTSASLSGTEDAVTVLVDTVNDSWWDLALSKTDIELDGKSIYKVSFDIDSSKAGTMSFDIENTEDYNIKSLDRTSLDLNEGNNAFSFEFTKVDDAKSTLAFHLSEGDGNTDLTGASITIKNIVFEKQEELDEGYVINGFFDQGTIGWGIYNSNGSNLTISSENNEGVLSFATSNGSNYWDAQFSQSNIILDSGTYHVSFDLKASVDTPIHFDIEDTGDYNTKYYPETVLNLTNKYKSFEFDFAITADNLLGSTKNAKLQYNVGYDGVNLAGQKIYIDNVVITKTGAGSLIEKQTADVNFDLDTIITEDFKGLGVQWDPYQVHPLTDEEWQMVTERVDYLSPSFVRLMIYATTYCEGLDEDGNPIYNFESDDMKALIQELDYLESRQIEVVLGEWEHPDRFKNRIPSFEGVTCDSPKWAKVISGLMDYLINEKGYTCIKYYNYVNEANSDWSLCADYDKWYKGIHYLYEEFENIDILDKVSITGPDTVWDDGNTWLKNLADDEEFDQKIGLYDVHMYPTIDEITYGQIEEMVKEQRSIVDGKDFYMTEIGMVTGKTDGDSQPYTKEFSYGVIMADAAAQVMRGGLSGVAIWDLDDAMHDQGNGYPSTDIRSLKQWGFWNSIAGRVYNQPEEENIRPHFYTWSLMSHLFPRHSSIINSTLSEDLTGLRTVGMKTEDGQMTYMIVNDSNIEREITIYDNSDTVRQQVLQYNYFEDDRTVNENGYPIVKETHSNVDFGDGFTVSMPSGGVIFLTTLDMDEFDVVCDDTENGSVEVDKTTVGYSEDVVVTLIPNEGYEVEKLLINGKEVEVKDNQYVVENVREDIDIKVTYKKTVTIEDNPNEEDGEKLPTVEGDKPPVVTGDNTEIAVFGLIGLISLIAIVFLSKKQKRIN